MKFFTGHIARVGQNRNQNLDGRDHLTNYA